MTKFRQWFISSSTFRVKFNAFKQITDWPIADYNEWLEGQLSSHQVVLVPEAGCHQRLKLWIDAKFDYENSIVEVLGRNEYEGILAQCGLIWLLFQER